MGQAHADPAVVAAKYARIREPHVAPLSDLADKIAAAEGLPAGAVPYPDPDFGGILARALCLHWNVCPFPTALDQSSTAERTRAVRHTTALLRLLPRLELVVLLGRAAEDGWRRAAVRRDDLTVLTAPHPSNRGINAVPGNQDRFLATMKRVADDLSYPPRHPNEPIPEPRM